MDKTATADHPILSLIQNRWSPVVFADEPMTMDQLASLFEAARWAPSCYNDQPWSFVLGIRGQGDSHQRVLSCLVDANQEWAQHAPVLGISVANSHFRRTGKPNRHAFHDVGLSMGMLILQAEEMGLSVHQMAGFRVEQAKELLGLPNHHEPVAAFAIGHRGDPSGAPEKLRQRDEAQRTRRKQEEFVFIGEWPKP